MTGTTRRVARLIVASGFIPLAVWLGYVVARRVDGDPDVINLTGVIVGLIIVIASVFAASRIAADEQWSERAAVSLGLSAAFFLLTWVEFGDPSLSEDAAPHVVWYAACVAAFAPAVVVIPASRWAWSTLRASRQLA